MRTQWVLLAGLIAEGGCVTRSDGGSGLGPPEKVGDVPGDGARAPFHVYVSNQSFDEPEVDIEVWIDDSRVIAGDFDVGNQHNWILFELSSPVGAHQLHAEGMNARAVADESFELPAERWAVLDFWFSEGEWAQPATFTWQVLDEPPMFN